MWSEAVAVNDFFTFMKKFDRPSRPTLPRWLRGRAGNEKTGFRRFCLSSHGAQERTRTSTELPPLAPEASASTNSATWAT